MARKLTTLLLAGVTVLALTGCDRIRNVGEAGRFLDEGGFGDPTMNNMLVMTGQRSYVEELSTRFAQEVPTTINFAFNSATLDQQARAVLRQQAQWILQFPEVRFSVYGHTDLVGSDAYNQALGMRRARGGELPGQPGHRPQPTGSPCFPWRNAAHRGHAGTRTAQPAHRDGGVGLRTERPARSRRALRGYRLSRLWWRALDGGQLRPSSSP